MGSLTTRVLAAAGAVLVLFLGLTVVALDIAFRNAAERATRDRLDIQVLALMSAADVDEAGRLYMPDSLPEPRFTNPGSGLFAQILNHEGVTAWRSLSSVGVSMPVPERMEPGERIFRRTHVENAGELFVLGFTVSWESDELGIEPQVFHFMVGESLQPYLEQVARFRGNLFGWFGLVFAGLIGAQLLILRRTLRPLRDLAEEVADVESGRRDGLRGDYPRELQRLARNLNALIRNERGHLRRYRDSLADLAHSLKTPLAVLRGALRETDGSRDATIESQVTRMDDIVRHQLQRAAALGGATFGEPVPVAAHAERVIESLAKAHAGKSISFSNKVETDAVFRGGAGDLLEILGNLMDNACKWTRGRVEVGARDEEGGLLLWVLDDGDGIPLSRREAVLARGTRADERVEGDGFGLAIVDEIVTHLGGTLTLGTSAYGGLSVQVRLPPPNLR